jgi:hypothetical protein
LQREVIVVGVVALRATRGPWPHKGTMSYVDGYFY